MEPLPIPILNPSTEASIRFFACWAVTTETIIIVMKDNQQ